MRRRWPLLALASLLIGLAGCKVAVYSQLSEGEANDALYTLLQGGVDAEKRADPDAGFSIWADKAELGRAIGLLKAQAQPQAKHANLGELFGRNQLISTPAEERVRFIYGVEQSLAQTLSKIDGVLVARVHIVLPANDPLAHETRPSSASVFIKHRGGDDLASSMPAIKELVVRSIEGLSVERVAVTLFASDSRKRVDPAEMTTSAVSGRFLGVAVPATSTSALWLRFTLLLLVATLATTLVAGAMHRRSTAVANSLRRPTAVRSSEA